MLCGNNFSKMSLFSPAIWNIFFSSFSPLMVGPFVLIEICMGDVMHQNIIHVSSHQSAITACFSMKWKSHQRIRRTKAKWEKTKNPSFCYTFPGRVGRSNRTLFSEIWLALTFYEWINIVGVRISHIHSIFFSFVRSTARYFGARCLEQSKCQMHARFIQLSCVCVHQLGETSILQTPAERG